jgi:hypothetical protein
MKMGPDSVSQMESAVIELRAEWDKFEGGNSAAGTRARKIAQSIKGLGQEVRVEIQAKKNAG